MTKCFCCHRRMISRLETTRLPTLLLPDVVMGRLNCGGECWRCMVEMRAPGE